MVWMQQLYFLENGKYPASASAHSQFLQDREKAQSNKEKSKAKSIIVLPHEECSNVSFSQIFKSLIIFTRSLITQCPYCDITIEY